MLNAALRLSFIVARLDPATDPLMYTLPRVSPRSWILSEDLWMTSIVDAFITD